MAYQTFVFRLRSSDRSDRSIVQSIVQYKQMKNRLF